MKKLLILTFLISLIGCTTEETPTENPQQETLNIPSRYHGERYSAIGDLYANIAQNKITIELSTGEILERTEGVITLDNGTNHFEAILPNNEKLVLLNGNGVIGITLYREDNTVLSSYYR